MNERNNKILNFNKKLTRTSQKNPRSMFYLSKSRDKSYLTSTKTDVEADFDEIVSLQP